MLGEGNRLWVVDMQRGTVEKIIEGLLREDDGVFDIKCKGNFKRFKVLKEYSPCFYARRFDYFG